MIFHTVESLDFPEIILNFLHEKSIEVLVVEASESRNTENLSKQRWGENARGSPQPVRGFLINRLCACVASKMIHDLSGVTIVCQPYTLGSSRHAISDRLR